jgi:hypothetical protein
MKTKFSLLSILISLFFLSYGASARVDNGVGHGGGGEWNVITCNSNLQSGQKLSLKICLEAEPNEPGHNAVIPCDEDETPYLTINHYTKVSVDDEMIESVKIPGSMVYVDWQETSFLVQVSDSIVGDLKLVRMGTYDQDLGTTLSLNLPSMKYELKTVTCDFGSN